MRLCECGCGQPTRPYNQTNPKRGIFKGEYARFVHGHNGRGQNSVQWKGQQINGLGYVRRWLAPGCSEYDHRLVAEEILGRPLDPDEIVHHIDDDRENNDPSNLEVMSRADHMRLHMHGQEVSGIRLGEYVL